MSDEMLARLDERLQGIEALLTEKITHIEFGIAEVNQQRNCRANNERIKILEWLVKGTIFSIILLVIKAAVAAVL